jgi:peptidoglycan/LPS O-acetylase OafA/YrhL
VTGTRRWPAVRRTAPVGGRFIKLEEAIVRFLGEAPRSHSEEEDLMETTTRGWLRVAATAPQPKRLASLDVLRTAAVALVIASHWGPLFPGDPFARLASRSFGFGVDLFFVLSGFLVSGLIFREHQRSERFDGWRFLGRRGFKIYPAFYVLLAVTVLARGMLELSVTPRRLLSEIFFVQNYGSSIWSHTWSLAVEEHFYIGLAIIAVIATKRGWLDQPQRMLTGIMSVCGVVLAMRITYALTAAHYDWNDIYAPTHLRIDSLLIGVLLAYLYHFKRVTLMAVVTKHRRSLLTTGLLLLTPALAFARENPLMYTFGLTSVAVGFGLLLITIVTSSRVEGWTGRASFQALAYLGRYSYSVYLWHVFVMVMIYDVLKLHLSEWPLLALDLSASFLVGILFAKLIEVPALRIRERVFPRANLDGCNMTYLDNTALITAPPVIGDVDLAARAADPRVERRLRPAPPGAGADRGHAPGLGASWKVPSGRSTI